MARGGAKRRLEARRRRGTPAARPLAIGYGTNAAQAPMKEIEGSTFELDVDLVLLAMGFLGPVKTGLLDELGVELTNRSNVKSDENKMTSIPGVFTAGDMTRGQSLVVWAIQEGRAAAVGVEQYLTAQK